MKVSVIDWHTDRQIDRQKERKRDRERKKVEWEKVRLITKFVILLNIFRHSQGIYIHPYINHMTKESNKSSFHHVFQQNNYTKTTNMFLMTLKYNIITQYSEHRLCEIHVMKVSSISPDKTLRTARGQIHCMFYSDLSFRYQHFNTTILSVRGVCLLLNVLMHCLQISQSLSTMFIHCLKKHVLKTIN